MGYYRQVLQGCLAIGMALLGVVFAWFLLSIISAHAQEPPSWQNQGLYGASPGDFEGPLISSSGDVFFCPNDGVYGLYQWNEAQSVWEPLTSTVGGCRDAAIDNINNRLYWLGGGAGMYNHAFRSDDGGLTWMPILTPAFPEMALVVEVTQVSTGTVYVGVNRTNCSANKVYRSTTGGASWQQAQLAPDGVNLVNTIDACLEDIAIDPTNSNYVYLAADRGGNDYGIYRSVDGGLTFSRIVTPTQDDADRVGVNTNNTVFARYDSALWRSYNQGSSWTNVNAPSDGLGFHPTLNNTVFVHGHRSDNEGDSWNVWAGDQFDPPTIDPNNTTHWYAFALPGVWRSTNSGSNFNPVNDGLAEVNVNRIAIAQSVTGTYWVAARDIGVGYTTDDGTNWTFPVLFGGGAIDAADIAIDPTNANRVYLASGEDVFITINGGVNWNPVQIIPTNSGQGTALAVDPQLPQTLYLAAATSGIDGGALYKSTNGGSSWITTTLQNVPIASLLVVSNSLTTTLYAGTWLTDTNSTGGLYRSIDGGASWMHLGLDNSEIVDIAVDPRDPAHLYAGAGAHDSHHAYSTDRGVYRSTNGGQSWTKVLNDRVFDIAVDPANPDLVYAIIWMNIWRSTDAGATWQLYYQHDWQNPTQGRPWALNIAQLPQTAGSNRRIGKAIHTQSTAQSILYLGSSRGLYSQAIENASNTYLPVILKASS